ncbi:MAG: GPP34 family phosphoprotein [Chlorobi bacterium]|nr:GPP34 family phosphoprotein [Chlorobiota bacterium]
MSLTVKNFLTVPEGLYVLALHETEGHAQITGSRSFRIAVSGAILMNLALENRIDSDLERIIIDKTDPTGDELLDMALNDIQLGNTGQSIQYWIEKIAEKSENWNDMILHSLVKKGILKMKKKKIFWVFTSQNYPVTNNTKTKEVNTRIRELVMNDEIPEIQDIVITSLLFYSGMLDLVLSDREINDNINRIEQIAKMDLVGQSISKAIEKTMLSYLISKIGQVVKGGKTAEEKLQEKVQENMKMYDLKSADDLPSWLKKDTDQYEKTKEFVEKVGTADIIYNSSTDKYTVKRYFPVEPPFC